LKATAAGMVLDDGMEDAFETPVIPALGSAGHAPVKAFTVLLDAT